MTPINEIPAVCNYGTSAVYSDYPSPEQMRAGVVPLDSLPAAWWNKMWCASNCAINEARDMVGQLITELNSVLAQAGICPQAACTDQLYQSINLIRQRLATASVPGAVVSSSTASEVAVDPTTGRMSVNCLGNAASLTTSASTVVGAINELKSTYDCCFSDTATAIGGKAPTSHASSATTYGVGNADNYGHLKISDTYTSVLAACSGVAASQKALACVYAVAAAAAAGNVALGNTAGCALGTAAAGTAITAARSDHVHPVPSTVIDTGDAACKVSFNYSAAGLMDPTWVAAWNGYELRATYRACLCVKYATSAGSVSRATFGDCSNGEHNANNIKSNGLWYYTSNGPATTLGASTNDGALYSQAYSTSWVTQIAQDYRNGNLFVRGLNNGTWTTWKAIPTKDLFGSAATLNKKAGASTVTYVEYSGANGCCLLAGDFLAYWNGAYNSTGSSNLKYTSVGQLGSAAACDASCFRASTWTPTCVACAGKDGSGHSFGTAARYACECFRPSTWTPSYVATAGSASFLRYDTLAVQLCHTCPSNCSCWCYGKIYLCNTYSKPLMLFPAEAGAYFAAASQIGCGFCDAANVTTAWNLSICCTSILYRCFPGIQAMVNCHVIIPEYGKIYICNCIQRYYVLDCLGKSLTGIAFVQG